MSEDWGQFYFALTPPIETLDTIATVAIASEVMPRQDEEVDALLPLPPVTLHILMAVADQPRHGYAIIQNVAAATSGAMRLGAGTLYRSVQRMLEQGLIEELPAHRAPSHDDERRRYYRITRFGEAVARADTRRMAGLLRLARATRLARKAT